MGLGFGLLEQQQPTTRISLDASRVAVIEENWLVKEANKFSYLPDYGTKHPRFPRTSLVKAQADMDPSGLVKIHLVYEGQVRDYLPVPEWSIQFEVVNVAIQAHPKFVAEIAGTPEEPLQDVSAPVFEPSLPTDHPDRQNKKTWAFKQFALMLPNGGKNPWAGVETFEVLLPTVSKSSIMWSNEALAFGPINKIDEPDWEYLPTLEDGANWRKTGIETKWRGEVVTVLEQWKASLPGGWLPPLYGGD